VIVTMVIYDHLTCYNGDSLSEQYIMRYFLHFASTFVIKL
jgi:hypothetical protein